MCAELSREAWTFRDHHVQFEPNRPQDLLILVVDNRDGRVVRDVGGQRGEIAILLPPLLEEGHVDRHVTFNDHRLGIKSRLELKVRDPTVEHQHKTEPKILTVAIIGELKRDPRPFEERKIDLPVLQAIISLARVISCHHSHKLPP